MLKHLALLLASFMFVGCASRTYDISVKNDTSGPINLWLTKDGGKPTKGWYTPEEFVAAGDNEPSPGIQLEAGKIADTGIVHGNFDKSVHAILLVSRVGAGGQFPVPVEPGKTELIVRDHSGKLEVYRPAPGSSSPIAVEP